MRYIVIAVCLWLGLVASCANAPSAADGETARIVEPCPAEKSLPVTRECAAASSAEEEFLRHTQRKIARYTIVSMEHSTTQWKFMIEGGDASGPPADGAHWMIFVNRTTGAVEVIPGK
jgi:hypothetical protein